MKLLQIVQTNSSTLDTTVPLLWSIRKSNPTAQIVILYCVSNRRQVLRNFSYIDSFCHENDIQQLDLSDLLKVSKLIKRLWKYIFYVSKNDNYPLKKIFQNPRRSILEKKYKYIGMSLRAKIENHLGNRLIDFNQISYFIKPDVVLFDLRQKTRFFGSAQMFAYLYKHTPPTLLLPHSPHDINETTGITSFDENGDYFPEFSKYLIPFKFSKVQEQFSQRKEDFLYCNYPAFDSTWIDYNKQQGNALKKTKRSCLIMIRNFYPAGVTIPEGEYFSVDYNTNVALLERIKKGLVSQNEEFHLIVKPHPKASYPRVKELFEQCDLKDVEITYDSFYKLLPKIDLVISNFTTSLLLPIFYGIPTITIEDYVQEYVNRWSVLESMYTGLELYCKKEQDLGELTNYALRKYVSKKDIEYLRFYFPDHYLEKNRKMIQDLLN